MRFKIELEYCGTPYCGFQEQSDIAQKSIEGVLRKALFGLTQKEVEIAVCGRTDAGVHALGQVVHFDLEKNLSSYQVMMGLNHYLRPEEVKVLSAIEVGDDFHARFSTKMRHYSYHVVNRSAPLVLLKDRAWQVAQKLDISQMQKAAKHFLGEHDFSSFRDSQCQAKSPIRTIEKFVIRPNCEEILFEVSAKSFLHHMVRNMVGTLVYVGMGKISADEIPQIIAAKNRAKSGPNAPACGLYFKGADYI